MKYPPLEKEDGGLLRAEQAKKLRQPPVVILSTGYPTSERLRRALKLRVDYLVLKPAEANEVTSVLQGSLVRREITENLKSHQGTKVRQPAAQKVVSCHSSEIHRFVTLP